MERQVDAAGDTETRQESGATDGRAVCIAWGRGCPRAQADTARYADYFEANDWTHAASIEEADLVVMMTCGFSAEFEEASIQLIEVADRRRKPGSRLIIAGCLAAIDPERLRDSFDALLVSREDGVAMDEVISAWVPIHDVADPNVLEPYVRRAAGHFSAEERRPPMAPMRALVSRLDDVRARLVAQRGGGSLQTEPPTWSLRVAQGCLGECTFCAIRFSAGPLHSKPLAEVLVEFDHGLSEGFTEFRLIAGDLGSYGQDIGSSIVDLLDGLMQRPQDFRLTLLDFDPKWFIVYQEGLVDLLKRNRQRIARIEIPLQSGSDRVLERMRRGHTADDALRALLALRAACPDMVIDTHVLIGFPGETDEDFQQTLDFLAAVRFTRVADYDYEDRPRTVASAMPYKVPRNVVLARGTRLRRGTGGEWAAVRRHLRGWGIRTGAQ
jgi:tRNA A37 methylthiotransferase MiaB